MLVIVQGAARLRLARAGTPPGDIVPTWNHVTAHLYGVPEILSADENLRVLEKLVDHFEEGMPDARSLRIDPRRRPASRRAPSASGSR